MRNFIYAFNKVINDLIHEYMMNTEWQLTFNSSQVFDSVSHPKLEYA